MPVFVERSVISITIHSDSGWSGLITPLLRDAWWEMRRQILLASRANSDTNSVLIADPRHMGDPAQKIAGAPVTRKVIQNADNIAVQLNPSSLWDGVCAVLVAVAGGTVVPIGSTEPTTWDEILEWWSQLGYERDPDRDDGSMRAARRVPGFVAGMRADRVIEAAGMCLDLPGGR